MIQVGQNISKDSNTQSMGEYDAFVVPGEKKYNLSVKHGIQSTPERSAKIIKYKKNTGLSENLIERNLDMVDRETKIKSIDFEGLQKSSPKLTEWMSQSPHNVGVAQNDINKLSYLDRQIGNIKNQFNQGKRNIELSNIGMAALLGRVTPEQRKKQSIIEDELSRQPNYEIDGFVEGIPGAVSNQVPIFAKTTIGGGVGLTTGAAVGSMLPGVGTAAGAVTGWRIGVGFEAASLEASLAYLEYENIVDADGNKIDRELAVGASLAVGVINGTLEAVGFDKIATDFNGLNSIKKIVGRKAVKEIIKKQTKDSFLKSVLRNIGKKVIGSAATEGATEFTQELISVAGKELLQISADNKEFNLENLSKIFSEENLNQMLSAGKSGAQAGGGLALFTAGPQSAIEYSSAKKSFEQAKQVENIGNVIESMDMSKTSPESVNEIIDSIAEDQYLYIDAKSFNTYFQSKGIDPKDIVAEIFGDTTEFENALEQGQDIAIPAAKYYTSKKLGAGENKTFLSQEVRTDPMEMSAREWQEQIKRLDEEGNQTEQATDKDFLTVEQDPIAQEPPSVEKKTVKSELTQKLKDAGYSHKVADSYARLWDSAFNSLGERVGFDPVKLFERFNPNINRLNKEQSKSFIKNVTDGIKQVFQKVSNSTPLDQFADSGKKVTETKEFKNWFGDSKVVDENGEPLVVYHGTDQVFDEFKGISWFTDSPEKASEYSTVLTPGKESLPNVKPVYLRMKKPKYVDFWITPDEVNLIKAKSKNDGVIVRNVMQSGKNFYITFEPQQIKSVNNRGTFDPNDPRILFQYIGERSQNAPIKQLQDARKLEDQGSDKFDIREKTGWFKGQDNKWRYEIDDSKASMKVELEEGDTLLLADVYEHPSLYEFYPFLKNIIVSAESLPGDTLARVENGFTISVDPNKVQTTETQEIAIIHEIQHLIQEFEGFASGGSPSQFESKVDLVSKSTFNLIDLHDKTGFDNALKQEKKNNPNVNIEEFRDDYYSQQSEDVWNQYANIIYVLQEAEKEGVSFGKTAFETYYNMAGEIEARDTQERKGLTEDQRRGFSPALLWRSDDASVVIKFSDGSQVIDNTKIPEKPIGAFRFGNGEFNIDLLADADLSTFLHETGHFFLEVLGTLSETEKDGSQIKSDYQTLLDWFGVESREQITTEHHEQFARGFEAYLMEGKAPSTALRSIFTRFKVWLTNIYKTLSGLNVELTDDVRGVFDRLIATDQEIENTIAEFNIPIGEEIGLGKNENKYQKLRQEYKDKINAKITANLMKDYKKKTETWYKDELDSIKKDVENELLDSRDYRLLSGLQNGIIQDGRVVKLKLNKLETMRYFVNQARDTYQPEILQDAEFMLNAISQGQAGKRGKFGGIASTFPEWFKNKGYKKNESIVALEKFINGQKLTEAQEGLIEMLHYDYINDDEISYFKNLESIQIDKIKTLIDNKFSQSDLELLTRLPKDEIVIEDITVGEILNAKKRIDNEKTKRSIEGQGVQNSNFAIEKSKNSIKSLPRGVTDPYGQPLDIIADLYDYSSIEQMFEALQNIEPIKAHINRVADERMQQKYPNLENDKEKFRQEIIQDIHDDARSDILEFELNWLANEAPNVLKDAIKNVGRRVPSNIQTKKYAKDKIAKTPLNQIRPDVYLRAEKNAAREAGIQLSKGNIDASFEQKRIEMINGELFKQATNAKENIDKILDRFNEVVKTDKKAAKYREMNYVNAAKAILAEYGFGEKDKSAFSYVEKIREYDPTTYKSIYPLINSALDKPQNYDRLNYDDFQDLNNTIEALWHLSREEKIVEINGERLERDEVIDELASRLKELKPISNKKSKNFLVDLLHLGDAATTRVESLADYLDGGDLNGVYTKYIVTPVMEATAVYRDKRNAFLEEYKALLDGMKDRFDELPIHAKELISEKYPDGYTFRNRAELIGALRHIGNDSNKFKMLMGHGWASYQDGILDTSKWDNFLSRMWSEGVIIKKDHDFIQNLWKLFEKMKPEAQKAHKNIYGYYFNEITATPFDTPFGRYEGGYAPAKIDPENSISQLLREDKNDLFDTRDFTSFPDTGSGWSKNRIEGYAEELDLTMSTVAAHIDSVTRFTYINPTVKTIGKILLNRNFKESIHAYDNKIMKYSLLPWIKRVASQRSDTSGSDKASQFLRFIRKSIGMNFMFLNVTNALMQYSGVIIAGSKVPMKQLAKGAAVQAGHLFSQEKLHAYIGKKSLFMKNLENTISIETSNAIREITINPSKYQEIKKLADKNAYILQKITQGHVNNIVWIGAYNDAISNNMTERQAVLNADKAVRLTQGTFNHEDLSMYETGSAASRIFTMFSNYFIMKKNLLKTEVGKIGRDKGYLYGSPQLTYLALKTMILPVAMIAAIKLASNGGDDDDEDLFSKFSKEFLFSLSEETTSMAPIIGPITQSVINRYDDKYYNDRLSFSPVFSLSDNLGTSIKELSDAFMPDEEVDKRSLLKNSFTLIGALSGLPLHAIGKSSGYLIDVNEGEAEPTGPIDFTRGLVTGKR